MPAQTLHVAPQIKVEPTNERTPPQTAWFPGRFSSPGFNFMSVRASLKKQGTTEPTTATLSAPLSASLRDTEPLHTASRMSLELELHQ
eukprot:CAMPEP_0194512358 /NCGR_PEP_ID=MMETSP0253-20130528/44333_1 /TAXON_ID=2966 /ORGANISM="Noctiluca scintillans" /LENGTH=87 /DNA_ID=CAMNT_0039355795 /DNA_START=349 /DNA_END=612 /DNA_ORIENTATION=+